MVKTKIKRDEKGLFVYCGGWFARQIMPYVDLPQITKFKEHQIVSATHPAGDTVYVKSKPDRKEIPECWGIDSEKSYEFHKKKGWN